jgi:hypothetical protein
MEETIIGKKAERHNKATNFEREKSKVAGMTQILHTYPSASRNPNKYFCILTRKKLIGDRPYAQDPRRRTHS